MSPSGRPGSGPVAASSPAESSGPAASSGPVGTSPRTRVAERVAGDGGEVGPGARSLTGTTPYTLARGLRVLGAGIREQPRMFTLAVAGSALYGVMTAGSAWALGRVTAEVITPAFAAGRVDRADMVRGAALLATVAVLLVIGVIGRRIAAGTVMFDLGAVYRRRVTDQYLRLPLSWHARHPAGQLLSNANADVDATWQVFAPLPMAIGVVVMLVVAAGAMVQADPVLALIGLAVFPLVFLVNVVFQRYMSPRVTRAQELRAEVSDVAHESFDGALLVKSLGREGDETARFEVSAERLRDANVEVGRTRGMFDPAIEAIPNLGTLVVLAIGSHRAASGAVTTADVVQVAYLFSLLAFPVRALGWVLGELPRSVVGWSRLQSVLQARGRLEYGTEELPGSAAVRVGLSGVGYAYRDADGTVAQVLSDVDVQIAAGRTVAVVGPTGSGKSTLAGLLVRLHDPDRGEVRVDGVSLPDLREGLLPAAVALVSQQAFLFDDTVRGNVTLGDPALNDADDRRVWAALRLAQADTFVAALSHGLDTQVGERGATLSGGQRQRIALARALVRRPRLLVMDDATSAVDPRVEAAILAGLRAQHEGTTVVVVAYRKATIGLADEVVYLDRGQIIDTGPHAELLLRQPGYRHLVDAYERDAARREQSRIAEQDDEASGGDA